MSPDPAASSDLPPPAGRQPPIVAPGWYSALKAADYFLAAARHDGVPPDPRLAEAIEVIATARRPDGTWIQGHRYPGRVWFEVDVPPGEPSRWLTFYAMRILQRWADATPFL